MKENIQQIVSNLPDHPGVYQFFDDKGVIIYIGKAKSLKKRVSSYFVTTHEYKKYLMVNKIADISTILVNTEGDALLLENNLIKQYRPRYNVMLKDDKSYPWIVVRNEAFPRVYLMRNPVKDGSFYFGPYASVGTVRSVLDLVKKLYQLRTCALNLTPETIAQRKFKICLEHHIGNCKGPCEGRQSEEEYNESIAQIKEILRGRSAAVIQTLRQKMQQYAEAYQFEEAEKTKQRLHLLEKYHSKSTVVNPSIGRVDVFSYADDPQCAYINYLRVVDGCIIMAHTVELAKKLDEEPAELLGYAITELRQRFESDTREIIVPFAPDAEEEGLTYTTPKTGDKKHLLDLSLKNARYYQEDKRRQEEKLNPERAENRIMETIRRDLRLTEMPTHIECFDNSNIQGTNPVASCVVFRNARPSKKDYRRFNIKTVEGPNDFASMEEVVFRRYRRMMDEGASLPQLIVVDGGKGQLSSAVGSLEKLGLMGKVAIVGIAKRLEEIYFPGDTTPIYLDKRSESLRLIQQMRDEAHRFGITFHRNKRSRAMIQSELEQIPGVGLKTVERLLQHFGSVKALKNADIQAVTKVVGQQKAELIKKNLTK